jgi:arabinoxylan arabinofuranohydrolase
MEGGTKSLVMRRAGGDGAIAFTSAPVPLRADIVYLRADVDFRDAVDTALFAYSYDGSDWTWLGDTVQMRHDLAHSPVPVRPLQLRHAEPGGYIDVEWFRVSDITGLVNPTHRQSEGAVHD